MHCRRRELCLCGIAGPFLASGNPPKVRLTIADNGMGISPDNLKRIFEPFFTTKQAVGTGLGLWISRELVKKNDGRIQVRSKGCGIAWFPRQLRRLVVACKLPMR